MLNMAATILNFSAIFFFSPLLTWRYVRLCPEAPHQEGEPPGEERQGVHQPYSLLSAGKVGIGDRDDDGNDDNNGDDKNA